MQNNIIEKRNAMPTLFAGHRFAAQKAPVQKQEEAKTAKIIPVHTASKLLEKKKFQQLISQCCELLDFSEEQKEIYITPLVHNFVEFVQNLPETRNSYFSKPGGIIEHALMRTASALSMCRAYFTANAPDKNRLKLGAIEMLWMYTLFSAGIFCGIGKVFSDLIIELYDEGEKHFDRWNPFEGNMIESKAAFYDYAFEETQQAELFNRRLSVLLAKGLIPSRGFAWISSSKEALSYWLALLEDSHRDAGILAPFMARADALAINTFFDEKRMQKDYNDLDPDSQDEINKKIEENEETEEEQTKREKLEREEKLLLKFGAITHSEQKVTVPGSEGDRTEKQNSNTQAGIEFLKWLANELKAQNLDFNTGVFYLQTGAIFLPSAIFEEFRRKNPYYRSTQDIIDSFNRLQLHTKGAENSDMHAFIQKTGDSVRKMTGVILSNAQLVLPKIVNVQLANGQRKSLSSTDMPNYAHLFEALQPVGKNELVATQETVARVNRGLFGR